jgi:hypothetical protein
LSLAETDPLSVIITHPFVNVDYVGVADRAMLISKEWDFVERIKLLALGISKAFLLGEASFAAAVAGLQSLMERLNTLRHKFVMEWIIPKLCMSIAEMHEFYERPKKDLESRIRVQNPETAKLIIPKIKWSKSLEPTQDASILNIWTQLNEKGIVSKRTLASGSGLDLEVERRNQIEEQEYEEQMAEKYGTTTSPVSPEEAPPPPPAPVPAALASRRLRRRSHSGDGNIFDMTPDQFKRKLRALDKHKLPPVTRADAAYLAGV